MKKEMIKSVVKTLNNISEGSFGTASFLFFNQPKEPKALKKLKENTKE